LNPASTSFVLAYHGCDQRTARDVVSARAALRPSHNDYDWLGDGIYFWEHNAQRAYEYALELAARPRNHRQRIKRPAVVGAVIDLGFCLNLLDGQFLRMVREAHARLVVDSVEVGATLPVNTGGPDLLSRKLDCAVLRTLHQTRLESSEPPFETVRAAFIEGDRLYDNAGFADKNHIQICVRDLRCIKAYFHPLDDTSERLIFE
jgi:hypothetical protein